jgi:hypothetical protein
MSPALGMDKSLVLNPMGHWLCTKRLRWDYGMERGKWGAKDP